MTILFITILGFFIGSFLCVVADRFGTYQSFLFGRSMCEKCHAVLNALDLVPVLSFLWLRGMCRHCHAPISRRYPMIEFVTAVLFGLTVWRFSFPGLLPVGYLPANFALFLFRDLMFVSLLLLLFLIDARKGILPDVFTLPGILFIFGINSWLGIPWETLLIGGLVVGGFFAAQYIVSRGKWVGDGDIRFGVLLGVMFGLVQGVLTLFLAYVIGAAFALILLSRKKLGMKSALPFGPFLAVAGGITLFFGPYLSLLFFPL